jgi:hypothetical protein
MPNKYLIFNRHALADECVTGNLAIFTDTRILLNFDKGAYLSVVPDLATVQVDELG